MVKGNVLFLFDFKEKFVTTCMWLVRQYPSKEIRLVNSLNPITFDDRRAYCQYHNDSSTLR